MLCFNVYSLYKYFCKNITHFSLSLLTRLDLRGDYGKVKRVLNKSLVLLLAALTH